MGYKEEMLKKILQDTSKLLGTAIENQSCEQKTDVLKILGKIIPTAIFVLLLPFSIIYMAISKVCSFIRKFFPR